MGVLFLPVSDFLIILKCSYYVPDGVKWDFHTTEEREE